VRHRATRRGRRHDLQGRNALRLCYIEDFRYSADLDFSLLDVSRDDATAAVVETPRA
jgi:predicted nucleotidyltransferase component of viral defense system